MVECSSRRRELTSAFMLRCRWGSSGKGYRLAPNASQICARVSGVSSLGACSDSAQGQLQRRRGLAGWMTRNKQAMAGTQGSLRSRVRSRGGAGVKGAPS